MGQMRLARPVVVLVLVLNLLAVTTWQSQGVAFAAAGFIPHRAIYGLSLVRSRSGTSSVTHAVGKLEFSWSDVCDGWAVKQRTHINLTNLDGSEIQFGWTLSSWEAKDGLSYRFFIRRLFGSGSSQELRGEAHLTAAGEPGEAVYSQPEDMALELPKGTIFPTQHSLILLEAASRGRFPLWRVVFDGTGDEGGLFGINAALVHALPPSADPSFDFPLINDVRSWRMSMAHFALENRSGEPAHEQELRLYQNGIVDELVLDYGDFALDAKLAELKALSAPDC